MPNDSKIKKIKKYFLVANPHWNKEGHKLISEKLIKIKKDSIYKSSQY